MCACYFLMRRTHVIDIAYKTFTVKSVRISGVRNLSKDDIFKKSGLRYGRCIFDKSVDEIRKNIESISWVHSAVVRRTIPSQIDILIKERTPVAYWQHKEELFLVDDSGTLLPTNIVKVFPALPISVGEYAYRAIPKFIQLLERFPLIKQQIVFCTFMGKRRWDIQISRGLLIRLPEENGEDALITLERMGNKSCNFANDVSVIDFRIPGRVIITKKKNMSAETNENEI